MIKLHNADYWINRPLGSEKDWFDHQPNWIESYIHSVDHPHRQMIIDIMRELGPIGNLLELGCCVGSNLLRIQESFPKMKLAGIDVNETCIARAREFLPDAFLKVSSYFSIPFTDKSFDAVLADASLMYANPDDIVKAIQEIDRVTRWAVIIVDRFNESRLGIRNGHVWARNYPKLLADCGFKTEVIRKISKKMWPKSAGWQKYGYLFAVHR